MKASCFSSMFSLPSMSLNRLGNLLYNELIGYDGNVYAIVANVPFPFSLTCIV